MWITKEAHKEDIHSTKDMSLPVRPPILPTKFPTPCAALLIAGPAADVTRVRPSEAFDVAPDAAFDAVSFVLAVAFEAVSVAEAYRRRFW